LQFAPEGYARILAAKEAVQSLPDKEAILKALNELREQRTSADRITQELKRFGHFATCSDIPGAPAKAVEVTTAAPQPPNNAEATTPATSATDATPATDAASTTGS
jgi:hypothetical protein